MEDGELGKALEQLSVQLAPTAEYIRNGESKVFKIFNFLKQVSKYQLNRYRIIGSIGKETGLYNSDFDVVIFVNSLELKDLTEVLDEFEKHLRPIYKDLTKTKCSLQFIDSKTEIDILPAINFVPMNLDNSKLKLDEIAKTQAEHVFNRIKQNGRNFQERQTLACGYNTCLCESQILFLKNQRHNELMEQLIRITKYWNKNLVLDTYVSGRSTLIELVTIFTVNQVLAQDFTATTKPQSNGQLLLSCFVKFLENILNFEELCIVFPDSAIIPPPKEILESRPLVLEPSNPYINMAKSEIRYFTTEIKEKLTKYAKLTLEQLNCGLLFQNILVDGRNENDCSSQITNNQINIQENTNLLSLSMLNVN